MKAAVCSLLFLALFCCVTSERRRYDGYQHWKVTPRTQSEVNALKVLYSAEQVIFGDQPYYAGREMEILVPPEKVVDIGNYFRRQSLQHTVTDDNYQKYLDREWARLDARYAKKKPGQRVFDPNDYNTLEDIMSELDVLRDDCTKTGLTCSTFSIGNSYEGRPLQVLKIGTGEAGKKGYWIDTLIHAREWLSAATLLKVASRLVREYNNHTEATELVNKYDWYYMPVHNPDGYVHSWTGDRLWRKSRNINSSPACIGTDLNRNYDQEWGTEGASGSQCSETYYGSGPASEPETQAVQNFAQSMTDALECWLTIHTAAQMWLMPWGHEENGACAYIDDHDDLLRASNAAADALAAVYGEWPRGNSCETIYPTSGTTSDYIKGKTNIKWTYTPELGGGDFVADPIWIQISFPGMWNAIVELERVQATLRK